jgi:hypothetical protein
MRPTVRLWESCGLGLILASPTGVLYSNQTGGHACLQPTLEGAFVPLCDGGRVPAGPPDPEARLLGYFLGDKHQGTGALRGLDLEDAEFIDETLNRASFSHSIRVDRRRLADSHEAWVWVIVRELESETGGLFEGFGDEPRSGVLTWGNSD